MRFRFRYLAIGFVALAMMLVLACGGDDDEDAGAVQQPAPTAAPAPPAAPAPAIRVVATRAPVATQAPAPAVAPLARATPVTVAPPPAKMAVRGGNFRWFPNGKFPGLDPVRLGGQVVRLVTQQYYDYPAGKGLDGQPALQMLDNWSLSGDNKVYTFTLRDGLKFHDGNPVRVEDVMASIERWTEFPGLPDSNWTNYGGSLAKVDGNSFTVSLEVPFSLWYAYWPSIPTYVMPERVITPVTGGGYQEGGVITEHIGSGPFKFVSWEPGHKLSLERFDDYVSRSDPKNGSGGERIAYLDTIDFIEVPDKATRVVAMQTKQGDFSEGIPNDFYHVLLDDPDIVIETVDDWAKPMMWPNKMWPPFNNPKSRLAIVAAMDAREFLKAGYGPEELWTACPAIYQCGGQWASDAGADTFWEVDLVKARRLWKEAVEETGFTGKIVFLANADWSDFYADALLSKALLESLGAEVDFQVMDWAGIISRSPHWTTPPEEGGWHAYQLWDEVSDSPLQDYETDLGFGGGYPNPKIQQLKKDFGNAESVEAAQAIVDEIQRIYWEEDPATIQYGTFKYLIAMQTYVKGFQPAKQITVGGVWMDK